MIFIPKGKLDLARAIEVAIPGDIIQVHSQVEKELAERAKARICPNKELTFRLVETFEIMEVWRKNEKA